MSFFTNNPGGGVSFFTNAAAETSELKQSCDDSESDVDASKKSQNYHEASPPTAEVSSLQETNDEESVPASSDHGDGVDTADEGVAPDAPTAALKSKKRVRFDESSITQSSSSSDSYSIRLKRGRSLFPKDGVLDAEAEVGPAPACEGNHCSSAEVSCPDKPEDPPEARPQTRQTAPRKQFYTVPKITLSARPAVNRPPLKRARDTSTISGGPEGPSLQREDVPPTGVTPLPGLAKRAAQSELPPSPTMYPPASPDATQSHHRKPHHKPPAANGTAFQVHRSLQTCSGASIQRELESFSRLLERGRTDIKGLEEFLQDRNLKVTQCLSRLCVEDDITTIAAAVHSLEERATQIRDELDDMKKNLRTIEI